MLIANEIKADIAAIEKRVNDGMRDQANDLAQIRQSLASARELRDQKLTGIGKRRETIEGEAAKAVIGLDREAEAAHDEYRKVENDMLEQIVTLEQALRMPEEPSEQVPFSTSEGANEQPAESESVHDAEVHELHGRKKKAAH